MSPTLRPLLTLALSLGLVGALSVIRFRTPVKEPEELAYVFLAIASGLALGADQQVFVSIVQVLVYRHVRRLNWQEGIKVKE